MNNFNLKGDKTMDFDKQALDRYITGNYGEGQFKDMEPLTKKERITQCIEDGGHISNERGKCAYCPKEGLNVYIDGPQ